jgi:hypothetical protein
MKTKVLILTPIILMLSLLVQAQEKDGRFGLEFNAGASAAIRKLGGAELKPGPGFELLLHYRFLPNAGIYAGWGWNKFGSDESFAGQESDFEETGYVFGLQFQDKFQNSGTGYFLRAGGTYNHIEVENEAGEIYLDSGHGLGWQVSAGLDFPLGTTWSLVPSVKFNALARSFETAEIQQDVNLDYLSLKVGIIKKF